MSQIFILLYDFLKSHRIFFVSVIMAIALLAGYFSSKITFEEDISKMLPVGKDADKINFILQNAAFNDKLIINVSLQDTNLSPAPEKLIAFANELADTLQSHFFSQYIKEVFYKVSNNIINEVYSILYENLPVFLNKNDYEKIDSLLTQQAVSTSFKKNYKTLISPAGFALRKFIMDDPVGISAIVLKKLQLLQFDDNYEIHNGYILTKDKKNLLLFLTTSNPVNETSKNTIFIEALDNVLRNFGTNKTGNIVKAEYFGAVAVSVCNAERIKKDIILTVTIALIILMTLISLYFRRMSVFLFIFLPAIFGGGVSLALLFLIKAKISLIALSIGAVLLGISVDYSLHIFTHFRHKKSVKQTIKDISLPIIMSSLTTASAFLCLLFVTSETLHELGLFAAISVITAAFFSLIVLPHLLKIPKIRNIKNNDGNHKNYLKKFTSYRFDKNHILISIIVILSIVFVFTSKHISFESDMEKMSYVTDELSQAEKNLDEINNYKLRSIYLACTGKDLNRALLNNEKYQKKIKDLTEQKIIKKCTSVSSFLISDSLQKERIELWNQYWTYDKKQKLKQQLITLGKQYKFKDDAYEKFYILLDKQFHTLDKGIFNKIKELFFNDYITETDELTSVITLLKVDKNDKQKIHDAFIDNNDLIILDKGFFVSKFINVLKKDFGLLIKLSLLIVLLILIISFGRIELGLITFIPITLSWLWTLGIMGIFGIKFNIFNIIVSTLIFGLGIDYSIFIMRGLLQEHKTGIKNLNSYKTSILLSAITTITGIGVLIFAKHPALNSIALVSIIGILSVVLISYTIQPLLFRFLIINKGQKRFATITLSNLFISIFTAFVFVLGCFIMMLFLPVLYFLPLKKKSKKLFVNYMIMLFCRIIVYINITIKKTIINYNSSTFKEPAIIISNHQSHLDLVLLLMLHPKIIVLTNDWVWKNKFYGLIVRYADYYSVTGGYEKGINLLKEKVKNGYSILIFPEAKRSATEKIKRFHKGAFYLADKLNLEILPLIIHGSGHCLTRGEVFLRSGNITIKFFNRINIKDGTYGNTYLTQAKSMVRFYREEYDKLRLEYEAPGYFRNKLINQYIYKGPVLEWYLRIKLRLEKNYALFNELIPQKADITDIGCGYGFMSYVLGFLSDKRNITGIDYDAYKIEIANNCISDNQTLKKRMKFVYADIGGYPFNKSDVFILSDILHYMPEQQQEKLI
ncbi:MAG: MMPL family transporter, partial [Bacteroidales bacterium]|nr:MMPL family transporter [Bacteroidales bacterium]